MKKRAASFFNSPPSLIWYLSVLLFFLLVITFALRYSLRLSLWGDDWFMFYIIDKTFGPGNPYPYVSLKGYLEPMGIMNLNLMINRYFFGYSSFPYYFVSMMYRTAAAFVGFLFLSKLFKSKFIGLIGSLFVLVGYNGVDTTNYVVHMNTYLVLLFLFLSLIFLVDSYGNKLSKYILTLVFFALSLIASPLRSSGLLPSIIIFDVIFGKIFAKTTLKRLILRQIIFVVIFLLIRKLGFFGSVTVKFIDFSVILQMLRRGDYTFISAFITTLGKAFFPDIYSFRVDTVASLFGANWFKWIIAAGFLAESLLFWFLVKITHQKVKSFFILLYFLSINFFIVILIFRKNFRSVELFTTLIYTFIGVFLITFTFWALQVIYASKKEKISVGWVGMVSGPVFILASIIVPLLFTPGRVLESNHRYLALSPVGVALTLASFLKIAFDSNKKLAYFVSTLLVLLIVLNIKADRRYFLSLYPTRNPERSNQIWNQFFKFMPETYPDKFLLFYFDDTENSRLASDAFLYGFPSRVGLKYQIFGGKDLPSATTIYDEVISAVTDGKAFRRLGHKEEKIGIDQVYAFKIRNNGDLVNITEKTREDLTKSVNTYE